MPDEVLVERHSGAVTITLNRPDRLNAFNAAQHRSLRAALTKASTPS